jgi:hypothetical protein
MKRKGDKGHKESTLRTHGATIFRTKIEFNHPTAGDCDVWGGGEKRLLVRDARCVGAHHRN